MSVEILAPVGGYEQLIAAVKAGTDAVYFGAENFNARRNAHNFVDLSDAVGFCHSHGVKAYITLNTVIKNSEIGSFANTVRQIAKAGADAVIVQDLGGISLIKQICPDLPLHASTQMTVHNLSGVRFLEKLGFSRAVLSRELSAKEIKYICDNTDMQIEVFVHGALCVCVSGQCYLSSMLGARSGNRGLCAQPCRLDFKNSERPYALSLKDMSLYEDINELINCNVSSLKIEGRMKRPEYVFKAVSECKKALAGRVPDMKKLQSVFSRSGFTDGYFKGRLDTAMFGRRTDEDVSSMKKVLSEIENTMNSLAYPNRCAIEPREYKINEFEALSASPASSDKKIRIRAERYTQLTDKMIDVAEKIILPLNEIMKLKNPDKKLVAELPLMFYGEPELLQNKLENLKAMGVTEVMAGNIGAMYEALKMGFVVHTDYSMNVTNKYSQGVFRDFGVKSCTMSFETNVKDIKSVIPVGIIAYGYLPLMTYRSCPAKTKAGCKACNKSPVIRDRRGVKFTVLCRGSYSQLLNCVPLYIADKLGSIKCDFVTLYFTKETKKECAEIFESFIKGRPLKGDMTRGLYFKELI